MLKNYGVNGVAPLTPPGRALNRESREANIGSMLDLIPLIVSLRRNHPQKLAIERRNTNYINNTTISYTIDVGL